MTEIFVAPPVVEPELAEAAPAAVETVLRAQRRRRSRPPVAVIVSITWLVVVVLAALLADLLPIADPTANVGVGIKVRPFTTWSEPLGTDGFGTRHAHRVIYGSRLSLAAGIGSVAIAMAAGLAVGTFAGYRPGRVDWFVGVVTDAMLSIPSLVLLLAIVAVLQPSLGTVILGLSLIVLRTS